MRRTHTHTHTQQVKSVTSATFSDHVVVLFEDDVVVVVVVEQSQRQEPVGHAARLPDAIYQLQLADDALHGGVIGRPLVLTQRERTLTPAVVRIVTYKAVQ